jgi:hypothetical protein
MIVIMASRTSHKTLIKLRLKKVANLNTIVSSSRMDNRSKNNHIPS